MNRKILLAALAVAVAGCGSQPDNKVATNAPSGTTNPPSATSTVPDKSPAVADPGTKSNTPTSNGPGTTPPPSGAKGEKVAVGGNGEPKTGAPTTGGSGVEPLDVKEPKAINGKVPPNKNAGKDPFDKSVISPGWTATKITPLQIAANAEEALNHLQMVQGDVVTDVDMPIGPGSVMGVIQVVDKDAYRFRTFSWGKTNRSFIGQEVRVRDKKFALLNEATSNAHWNVGPIADAAFYVKPKGGLADTWALHFQQLIPLAVGGSKPLTAFVKDAKAAGYSIHSEERISIIKATAATPSKTIKNIRILAERPAGKGVCGSTIDMIFGEAPYLPVTVAAKGKDTNGDPMNLTWTCYWQNHKKFEDTKIFVLPPPGQSNDVKLLKS